MRRQPAVCKAREWFGPASKDPHDANATRCGHELELQFAWPIQPFSRAPVMNQRNAITDDAANQSARQDVARVVHITHDAKRSGGCGNHVSACTADSIPR